MCRSIHILRTGREIASPEDIEAAARQYVRKVCGFSKPTAKHQEAFDQAVAEVAASTHALLELVAANIPATKPRAAGE